LALTNTPSINPSAAEFTVPVNATSGLAFKKGAPRRQERITTENMTLCFFITALSPGRKLFGRGCFASRAKPPLLPASRDCLSANLTIGTFYLVIEIVT
jgi:hypothetical protein